MSEYESNRAGTEKQEPKLLDRIRQRMIQRGYGLDAQNRNVEWCRQFILFHNKHVCHAFKALQ